MTSQLGFQPSPAPYPHSLPGVILQHQQLPPWQTSMVGYAFGNGCPPGIPPFPAPPALTSWNPPVAPAPAPSDSAFTIHHHPHRSLPSLQGHNTAFQALAAPPVPDCDGFRAVTSSLADHSRDAPQSSNSQASDKETRVDNLAERTPPHPHSGFGSLPGSSSRQFDRDDYLRALLCTTSSHQDFRSNRNPADAKAGVHYRRPGSTPDVDLPGPSVAAAATRNQLANQAESRASNGSGASVTPQQVKDVIGMKDFYMVRAKLIRQQQTLAEQILELNKLVRMQGILVSEVLHPEYENCRVYHEELRNEHKQDMEQQDELCNKLAEDLPLLLHLPSKIRGSSASKLDMPERYKFQADCNAGLIKPTPRYKAKDSSLSSFDAVPHGPHVSKLAAQLEKLQSHSFQDVVVDKVDCNDSRIGFPAAQQVSTPTMSGAGQTNKPSNAFDPHADWFARHFTSPKPAAPAPSESQPVASETICKTTNTSPQPKAAQWWKDHAKIFGDIVLPSQLDSTALPRESCWTRSSQDILHPPLKKRSKFQGVTTTSDRQETSQSLPSLTKATVSKKERKGKTIDRLQGTSIKKSALKRVRYGKGDAKSTRDSARSEPGSGRSASSEGGFVCASEKSLKSSSRQQPAPTQSITQESAAVHTLLSFTSNYKLV